MNGPAFLRAPVAAAFPTGFSGPTAVMLVRPTSGAVSPSTPPASAPPTPPTTSTYGQTVAQVEIQKTNEQHVANGLPALRLSSQLTAAAEAYAQVVFQLDPYLSNIAAVHTLDADVGVRVTRTGYRCAGLGENAASASATVQPDASAVATSQVDGWMNSPPHRANIVAAEYTETGVGCATGRPASVRVNLDFAVVCIAVYGTPR